MKVTVKKTAAGVDITDGDAAAMRALRDELLKRCDWTQLSDSTANVEAWAIYRQALRDVPQQEGFPETITWPVPPA